MRRTLDGVRAMPLWRSPVGPAIFFTIVGVLVLALAISVAAIRSEFAVVPVVDTAAEAKVAREKLLRSEAEQLLRSGNVAGAYGKVTELSKLAPHSRYAAEMLGKLNAVREQQESSRQQLVLAKQRLDEGIALYNDKQYTEAIQKLEESFHLNPNSDDAANYLKLAQQDQAKERQQQAPPPRSRPVSKPPATVTRAQETPKSVASDTPVHFTTMVKTPSLSDGYIMVKIGGEVVAYEQLWQDQGRFIMRHKVPREVNTTKQITPKTADIEVWVIVQSMDIQEHRTFLAQKFVPGSSHHLTVTFDAQSKKFDFRLN